MTLLYAAGLFMAAALFSFMTVKATAFAWSDDRLPEPLVPLMFLVSMVCAALMVVAFIGAIALTVLAVMGVRP